MQGLGATQRDLDKLEKSACMNNMDQQGQVQGAAFGLSN